MQLDQFLIKRRQEAERLSEYGAQVDPAKLIARLLAELCAAVQDERDGLLTLSDAARQSGYSADHVGRLVRTGKLPNHGTRHRLRVRAGDLPKKPHQRVASTRPVRYDPETDARSLGRQR